MQCIANSIMLYNCLLTKHQNLPNLRISLQKDDLLVSPIVQILHATGIKLELLAAIRIQC